MKLPRDLSGAALIRALGKLGYRVTRQAGSDVAAHSKLSRDEVLERLFGRG